MKCFGTHLPALDYQVLNENKRLRQYWPESPIAIAEEGLGGKKA